MVACRCHSHPGEGILRRPDFRVPADHQRRSGLLHQARTFSYAGFHGGYYTLAEATNVSGSTPFGLHGPGPAMLYGVFGALRWHRHTVVLLNLLAISVAAWTWISLSRMSLARLFLGGVLLVTSWHIVLWHRPDAGASAPRRGHRHGRLLRDRTRFLTTSLGDGRRLDPARHTVVHQAIVVILLPLWGLATSRRRLDGSCSRPSRCRSCLPRQSCSPTAAPPALVNGLLLPSRAEFSVGAQSIVDNGLSNVRRLSMLDQYEFLELLHRSSTGLPDRHHRGCRMDGVASRVEWRTGPAMHLVVAATAMAIALAAMLLLYEFTSLAEHRVLSAFFLFGSLLCLAAPGRIGLILVAALILSNLAYARPALRNFEAIWRDHFVWDRRESTRSRRHRRRPRLSPGRLSGALLC